MDAEVNKMKVEAKREADQMKLAHKAESDAAKQELDQARAVFDAWSETQRLRIEEATAALERALEHAKAVSEHQLAREKMASDAAIKKAQAKSKKKEQPSE